VTFWLLTSLLLSQRPPPPTSHPETATTRWELHWIEPEDADGETFVTAVTPEGVVVGTTTSRKNGRFRASPFVVWHVGAPPTALPTPKDAEVTLALGSHATEGFVGLARFPGGRVIPLRWTWSGEGPYTLPLPAGATGMAEAIGLCADCDSATILVVGALSLTGGDPYRAGTPWAWTLPDNGSHPIDGVLAQGRAQATWGDAHNFSDLYTAYRIGVVGTWTRGPWSLPHLFYAWGKGAIRQNAMDYAWYCATTFLGVSPACSASALTNSFVGWAERANEATPCGQGTRRAMELQRRGYDHVPFPFPEPEGTMASEASAEATTAWGMAYFVGWATGPAGVDQAMLWVREESPDVMPGVDWTYQMVDLPRSLAMALTQEEALLRARGVSRAALIAGDGRTSLGRRGFILVPLPREASQPLQTQSAARAAPPQVSTFRPASFEISSLPSPEPEAAFVALDVDASGDVVGYTETAAGLESHRAVRWSRTLGVSKLFPLPEGWGPFSEAAQTDETGRIIGTARLPSRRRVAVLWSSPDTQAKDILGEARWQVRAGEAGWQVRAGESRGRSMRRQGEDLMISVEANVDPGDFGIVSQPFCLSWKGGVYSGWPGCKTSRPPWPLTKASRRYTEETLLAWQYANDQEAVPPAAHANETPTGRAEDNSATALAVGYARVDDKAKHAMLWTDRYLGGAIDLNDLLGLEERTHWVLERALVLSAAGAIAGVGRLDGVRTGFVLFPKTPIQHRERFLPPRALPADSRIEPFWGTSGAPGP
jgi:hypothetical protein